MRPVCRSRTDRGRFSGLVNPLVAGTVSSSGGTYPATTCSLLSLSDPAVLLWSVKSAEEGIGQGMIARLWNQATTPKTVTLRTSPKLQSARRATHVETNLTSIALTNGSVRTTLPPNALQTYRLCPAVVKKSR